jgi:hypothetical protein
MPSFADNRRSFDYVRPAMWKWFEDAFLFGDTLYLLILAGSRNASRIIRFFADESNQKAAGMPFKVRIVGVFSENVSDTGQAWAANAHRRIYRYLLDFDPDVLKLLEPELKKEDFERIWITHQGSRFREYQRSVKKWAEKFELPVCYDDPNGATGQAAIAEWAVSGKRGRRRSKDGPPFHMLISNPFRTYVSYVLRRSTGEISVSAPTPENPKNRRLELVQGNACFGLSFGFHPNLPSGRQFGLEFMEGASPVDYYVESKLKAARLAMMGLGPGKMDNKELYLFDGPLRDFGLNPQWPPRRKRTAFECHEGGYQIVDWIWSTVERTLFGGGIAGNAGIAHVIAERVYALWIAKEAGLELAFSPIKDL